MKSVKIFLAVLSLGFLLANCTGTQQLTNANEEEENVRMIGNRMYLQDPFYGTVVLERDPFTGRYYDVTNGYRSYASPYYGNSNNYRRYGQQRGYNNYRNYSSQQRTNVEVIQKSKEETRRKILGND